MVANADGALVGDASQLQLGALRRGSVFVLSVADTSSWLPKAGAAGVAAAAAEREEAAADGAAAAGGDGVGSLPEQVDWSKC